MKCYACNDTQQSHFGGPCVCTGKVVCTVCQMRPATHATTLYVPAFCDDKECFNKIDKEEQTRLECRMAEKGF
jgi:hypothetical protein